MSLQIATTIIVKYYNITKYEKNLYIKLSMLCAQCIINWVGIADDVIVWCRAIAQYKFLICEKGTENTKKLLTSPPRRP